METSVAQLTTTMQMDVWHSQIVPGVLSALRVVAIVYNLVRLVMLSLATLQHTAVKRISFRDAVRWVSAPWYFINLSQRLGFVYLACSGSYSEQLTGGPDAR